MTSQVPRDPFRVVVMTAQPLVPVRLGASRMFAELSPDTPNLAKLVEIVSRNRLNVAL